MDIVTHSLVSVALSRAGLKRLAPQATWLLVFSANIPDVDYLARFSGPLAELEIHRGYTHCLLAWPLLALISALFLALLLRQAKKQKIKFGYAYLVALSGVGSHLLLDSLGSVGIRPLLPYSSRWFFLDLNGSYDGIMITALAFACIWPWFVNLVSGEIGSKRKPAGQGSAVMVLFFLCLYEAGRWALHTRALSDLSSRLFLEPLNVAALPEPNNPFKWVGIVEMLDSFEVVPISSFQISGGIDSRVFAKPPIDLAYRAVMQTEPFRYMAYFSRFPVWGEEPLPVGTRDGKLLDLTDLRFGRPSEGRFHATAVTNSAGQVLTSQFSFTTALLESLRERPGS